MKKILALICAGLLVFAGCSKNNTGSTEETKSSGLNVIALKGPTAMGITKLMEDNTQNNYSIVGTADEAAVKLTKGEVDIALIPSNLAATLYQKTNKNIKVAGINTLGVLYIVENGNTINSIADLKGKTIVSTGKGTTPEYALNHILMKNNIDPTKDVTIEYKSEATEVAAMLEANKASIAVLPQPYVSGVLAKNPSYRIALDLTKEWEKVDNTSTIVTGTVVVRKDVLENKKEMVDAFLKEYKASVDYVNTNVDEAAKLVAKNGIATEPIAKAAIPLCNIVLIEGDEMETKLNGYLNALYAQNPKSIGGALVDEGFYYKK